MSAVLPRNIERFLVPLFMAAYILIAVMGGPDLGWDLKNYHYYVGHNFWHGAFPCTMRPQDVFPAQVQGWFNPLLDALFVGLIENLPPVLATATVAFLQSLVVPLLYLLIRQTAGGRLKSQSPLSAALIMASSLAIGLFGAMTLSEIGTSFSDLLVAVPMLACLVVLGRAADKKNYRWFVLSGFCYGLAVGLKLTMAIFAPALIAALFCLRLKPKELLRNFALLGAGALAGLLISDGFWLWHIGEMTGNPFFPAMKGLFGSDWIAADGNLLDTRFRAQGLAALFRFPLVLALGQHPGAEVSYHDLRFVLAFFLFPVGLYFAVCKKLTGWPLALLVFFYVGFFVWLSVFGIMRYAVLLELLVSQVLLIILASYVPHRSLGLVLAALAILLGLTTSPPQWTPHLGWAAVKKENWFAVAVPPELEQPRQMFLMLSGEPTSYAIPFFPEDSAFVRMEGNLNPPLGSALYRQRMSRIAYHDGAFWSFGPAAFSAAQQDLLASYGFARANEPCLSIPTNTETLYACRLRVK